MRSTRCAHLCAAATRAIKLAPEFGDTYSVNCYLQSETLLRDCEDRLRLGRRVDPDIEMMQKPLTQEILEQRIGAVLGGTRQSIDPGGMAPPGGVEPPAS